MRNRQRSLTAADALNYGFGHLLRQEAQDEQVQVPTPQKVKICLSRGSDRCGSAPGFRANETMAQKLHRENNTGTYDNIGLVPPFARDTEHNDQAFFKMMKLSNESLSKYTSQYVPDHRKMLKRATVQVPAAVHVWSLQENTPPYSCMDPHRLNTSHRKEFKPLDKHALSNPQLPQRTTLRTPSYDTNGPVDKLRRWQKRRYVHKRPTAGAPQLTLSEWADARCSR